MTLSNSSNNTARIALVTGASRGIGAAIAAELAARGFRVIGTATTEDGAQRITQVLSAHAGCRGAALDVNDAAALDALIDGIVKEQGGLHVLVNNAGITRDQIAMRMKDDDWDAVLDTNLKAVFRACRAVLPHMQARKSGDIIVTSSIAGHEALPMEPIYSASKHAINAFVYGLRRQIIPDNIRVGAVAPGTVLNELWGITEESEIARQVADRTGIRSEDVADAVLYMLTRPPHVTIRDIVIMPQALDL